MRASSISGRACALALLIAATVAAQQRAQITGKNAGAAPPGPPVKLAPYGRLPLAFVPPATAGQGAGEYVARGPGYTLWLSAPEAVLALAGEKRPLRLELKGAQLAQAHGAQELTSVTNEYFGNDPKRWRTNLPNYGEVDFSDIYPGVSLRYYGRQGKLESDFVLAPGADPAAIRLGISGASRLRLDKDGNLTIALAHGSVTLGRPNVYQTANGKRRVVTAGYRLRGREARFTLGAYDRTRELVIDPTLSYSYNASGGYSTLLGANVIPTPPGPAMGVDGAGEAVLIGLTLDATFPTLNAYDATCASGVTAGSCTNQDVFVTKFNASGNGLVYSTYFGGNEGENGITGAVDTAGNAYVAGRTFMTTGATFPITGGVVLPTSGVPNQSFLAKFNSSGGLTYSTFLGGQSMAINGVAADTAGDAYVTGQENVSDNAIPQINPVPAPCSGGSCTDAFVIELNPGATQYLYGTYFGGTVSSKGTIANAITVDHDGDVDIGGSTTATDLPAVQALQSSCTISFQTCGFVTELNPALSGTAEIVFSTFLGEAAAVNGLAADAASPPNVYAVGTASTGVLNASLPVTAGAFETAPGFGLETPGETTFVAKIPTGAPATPTYVTYLGGSLEDLPAAIAADASGDAWIGGTAQSWDFPVLNPIGPCPSGNGVTTCDAGFVSELNPTGTALLFSTFIGGSSGGDQVTGIAVDGAGNVYAGGLADSVNFPFTPGAFQSSCASNGTACLSESGFVAKLAPQPAPTAPAVAIFSPGFTEGFIGFRNAAVITLTNTATSGPDLTVTGVASAGQPNFDFAANATVGGTNPACMANSVTPNPVAPGGSCDITVNWNPGQTGPDTGTVEIFDNAANLASPQAVFLSGNAINGARASVSPSPANFGDVVQGREGVETVTVTNIGNQSLTMGSIGVTGASDFALGPQLSTGCTSGESLSRAFGPTSPGGSCTITVVYNANGAFGVPEVGALTINDTSILPPGPTQTVGLNATTVQAEPAITPQLSTLNFGSIAQSAPSAIQTENIVNEGPGVLQITAISVGGVNAGDFHETDDCTTGPLTEFSSCTVAVFFQPSAAPGTPETAALNIANNDPNHQPVLAIPLTGTSGAVPTPPASLPFLASLNNAVPASPANNGTGASAASSGGQFVAFLGGNNSFSGGPSSNMPGPSAGTQGVSGLYWRNTCGSSTGPVSNCAPLTQFIAVGPTSGLESNGGAACLNQQVTQAQGASNPHISADGRYVAFNDDACPPTGSNAPQTEPGPILLRDTQLNTTTAVPDASGNPITTHFAMSGDARYFAYPSPASGTGAPEISATDTQTPSTILVSQSNNGTADAGNSLSLPSISPDGRYVAFASNFDDVNGTGATANPEVYLRDTCLGAPAGCVPSTILVSSPDNLGTLAAGGQSGSDFNLGGTATPGTALSSGGRYVAFVSNANNLQLPPNFKSGDAFPHEVYLRDTCIGAPSGCTPQTTLLSLAAGGTTPTNDSMAPQISSDGRIITFLNQGQLLSTAPFNALYSFDTCLSNGVAVGGCQPGLKGVISATNTGAVQTSEQYSLDATGQIAAFSGPPDGCTGCFQVWENSTGGSVANGVTVPLLSLTPSTTAPAPGAPVSFTITVANDGATDVTDVTVTDSITSNGSFGALPAGCTLTTSTMVTCDLGALSAGSSAAPLSILVDAPSAGGASLTDSASVSTGSQINLATQTSLTSTVTTPAFSIVPAATSFTGYLAEPFTQTFTTANAAGTVTLSETGTPLPSWLSFNTSTGVLSGTPPSTGPVSFSITAADTGGSVQASYTLNVLAPLSFSPSPANFGNAEQDASAPLTLTITNNSTAAVTFNNAFAFYSPTLAPFGFASGGTCAAPLAANGGSCTLPLLFLPTAVGPATGTLNILFNGGGTEMLTVEGNGTPKPSITTTTLPGGTAGQSYAAPISISNGTAPFTLSLASGTLPPGVGISGVSLAGVPTLAGSYTFALQATDAVNQTSTPVSYTVVIGCPSIGVGAVAAVVVAGTPPVPSTLNGTVGTPMAAIQFFGVESLSTNLPLTFSSSGNLDGLIFDPSTGILSGSPTAAGTFPFTIMAAGGGCSYSSATFTLAIVAAVPTTVTIPTIKEAITVTDNPLGAPNTLISANVIPPIPERITVTDNPLGAPNTLISANVIPPIPETITVTDTSTPAIAFVAIVQSGAPVVSVDSAGDYLVQESVVNNGNVAASLQLNSATLRTASGTTGYNKSATADVTTVSNLAPGAVGTFTLVFPASAGAVGAAALLQIQGSWTAPPLPAGTFGPSALIRHLP